MTGYGTVCVCGGELMRVVWRCAALTLEACEAYKAANPGLVPEPSDRISIFTRRRNAEHFSDGFADSLWCAADKSNRPLPLSGEPSFSGHCSEPTIRQRDSSVHRASSL